MIFSHSGNIGDVLWSLPFINHMTKGERIADLYIKTKAYEMGDQFTAVQELLLQQPYIKAVHPFVPNDNNWSDHYWPGLNMDYDLDAARWQTGRKYIYHVKRYFDTFKEPYSHPQSPWLKVDDLPYSPTERHPENYALIHYTGRWNASFSVDWKRVYEMVKGNHKNVYFIGFTSECNYFNANFGQVEQLFTRNLLEVARLVNRAEAIYCNQSPVLVLSQALGKEYYCAFNLDRTNCRQNTPNEHALK